MILILLQWIIFFLGSVSLALLADKYLLRIHIKDVVYLFLTGVFIQTFIAAILNFCCPLYPGFWLSITVISIAWAIFNGSLKKWKNELPQFINRYSLVFWCFCLLFVLFVSSLKSIADDDGAYHMPFIKWMQHYRLTTGLGNLHDRFAFNSNFHLLTAYFNTSEWLHYATNKINGLFYIVFLYRFLVDFERAKNLTHKWIYALLIIFIHWPHFYFIYHVNAPSPDYIVFLLTLFFLSELLVEGKSPREQTLLAFIPIYLVTVKISSFPLVLFALLFLYRQLKAKEYKTVFSFSLLSILMIGLWLVRNFVMSGYLVYPIDFTVYKADWQIPHDILLRQAEVIKNLGFKLYSPDAVYVNDLGFFDKYLIWFKNNLRIHEKLAVVMGVCSIMFAILNFRKLILPNITFALIASFGFAFWILAVADPRFGYAWIFAWISLSGSFLLSRFFIKESLFFALIVSVSLLLQAATLILYFHIRDIKFKNGVEYLDINRGTGISNIIYPEKTWVSPYQKQVIGGYEFYEYPYSQSFQWDGPLPNTDKIYKGLELRGKTIDDGFRIRRTIGERQVR
ncbi:LIC_10190 family membrane protein [Rurimicrobium arvi]